MAKAADKPSTAPRGRPLTFYFAQLRANGATRKEALADLTERLAGAEQVFPALPPTWHLELGPMGELLLVTSDGMIDAGAVFIYRNPFKPLSLVLGPEFDPANPSKVESPPRQPPKQSAKQRRSRLGPQMLRVLPVLKKLYEPDGVPNDVSTEDIRGRVNEALAPDNKNRGLAAVSWDTVNRALGRTRTRT